MKYLSSPFPAESTSPQSSAGDIFLAEVVEDRQVVPPRRPIRFLVAGVVVGLILVSAYLHWWPGELAKWRLAQAQTAWLAGDLEGALAILDNSIDASPSDSLLYEQRIRFCLENKDYEQALADCEKLVALLPKSPEAISLRSQTLHHLGRHVEAIKDCRELLRLSEEEWIGSRVSALNSLAYAQALGNTELEDALKNVNEALRLAGEDPAMLDTRGYILYRLGDFEAARADAERAVSAWQAGLDRRQDLLLAGVRGYEAEREIKLLKQGLAALVYHRALIYESLDMRDAAELDLQQVRELGFEPSANLF